ncbi:MAG TPA: M20 family metallopeptidase [Ktedonobacteraceae bacterium]|nr:M20 family metallopeptidase [Ktedonobacteraceae bacterium]
MSILNIQASELWEISRQLIGFNTVSAGSNMLAAEYLANYLEDSGFAVRLLAEEVAGVQKANVIAWAGPEVSDGLIVSGHIDVVPFDGQPGWKSDPLVLQTDGQRIFGRGVSDMKVFLAQALLAAKRHPLATLKRPLVYIFTCDEELAGQGAARLIKTIPELFNNYPLPTVALIGEPTNFEIFPANKGYVLFDILAHGKGGHSSVPDKGLNAIDKMAEVIQLLQEMNKSLQEHVLPENMRLFPDSPYSTFNSGVISGGLAANMIAETCRLVVSMRVAPGDNLEEIMATLQERIDGEISRDMQAFSPDCGVFVENVMAAPPMRSPTDGDFCRVLSRVMGQPLERGAAYATDGGYLQQLGINSYICGPGLLAEAHQPNESLPVTNFVTGLERLEHLIYEWCLKDNLAH